MTTHEELDAVERDLQRTRQEQRDMEARKEEILQAIADEELAAAESSDGIVGVLRWWMSRRRRKGWACSRRSVRRWLRAMSPLFGWPDGQLHSGLFKIELSVRAADSAEEVTQTVDALNRMGAALRTEWSHRPEFPGLTVHVVNGDGPLTFNPDKETIVALHLTREGWTLNTPAPGEAQIDASRQDCAALVVKSREMTLGV
jgi:hypothetical protein